MAFFPARMFRRPVWPGWRALAFPVALGLLVATGQAPLGFWWAAVPALALLTFRLAAAAEAGPRIWAAWAAGTGHFAGCLFWIVEPFLVDPARDGWMAPFALVLMAGGMALFWALAGAAAGIGRGPATRALAFAAGLAGADLLRSYLFTGFPWALTGHVWIGTPVMQVAALIGPIGLCLATTVAAASPALGRTPRGRLVAGAAGAGMLAAVWFAGQTRLAEPDTARDPAIRVRIVQPNATQALKWRADMWDEFLRRQMEATALPADPPLDLIVWPETAVPWLIDRTGTLFQEMMTASGGVPVALGIQRGEGARYFNSLAVIDANGAVAAVYDKWHLVPFGEYVPAGDLAARFGIRAFAATAGFGYSAGPGPRLLDLGRAGVVLPLICYEAVFPQDLRAAERVSGRRADWILQVTNDGWFGALAGPYQHLALARLRAVEQGLPLLRAANTGVSAVIDAKGRVLARLALDTVGHLDAAVPPALPPTLYARTGDAPATVLISVALLGLFVAWRAAGR